MIHLVVVRAECARGFVVGTRLRRRRALRRGVVAHVRARRPHPDQRHVRPSPRVVAVALGVRRRGPARSERVDARARAVRPRLGGGRRGVPVAPFAGGQGARALRRCRDRRPRARQAARRTDADAAALGRRLRAAARAHEPEHASSDGVPRGIERGRSRRPDERLRRGVPRARSRDCSSRPPELEHSAAALPPHPPIWPRNCATSRSRPRNRHSPRPRTSRSRWPS